MATAELHRCHSDTPPPPPAWQLHVPSWPQSVLEALLGACIAFTTAKAVEHAYSLARQHLLWRWELAPEFELSLRLAEALSSGPGYQVVLSADPQLPDSELHPPIWKT